MGGAKKSLTPCIKWHSRLRRAQGAAFWRCH